MSKSYRIRTKVGEDSFVKVDLQQDFDLLEILSLKLTQSEVYARMCADYGVIVGRVVANSGLGVPNSKISIFIPLSAEDEKDDAIKEMYPFKDVTDKNEEGYRYNLLPTTKQHNRHTPTGSFLTADETISNPLKLEVYEKYYKFSAKTNENGDFMIWGVPLGVHQIHMSVDVSDIGCYSMKPFDFVSQGVSIEKFKNSAVFNESENLDTLPQIVIQNKTVESVSFWGDDEMCNSGISRVDFDLRDSNVEFRPNALFMGSILSDDNSGSLGWKCGPGRTQGDVCKLTTGSGKIEAVRFTVFKENDDANPNCSCRPKLEKINLHSIDGTGSFVAKVPMNLDYVYTDEFGTQQISDNPAIGVPTRGKYRFRISFDNEYTSETRKAKYLVPNIREYDDTGSFMSSYSFSTDLLDYPHDLGSSTTIRCDNYLSSPAFLGEDYFYEMFPDRVYTLSQFIDLYRNDYTNNPFDASAINTQIPGKGEMYAGYSAKRDRFSFIGIKSTNPPKEQDCSGSIKEFPANDGFRGGTYIFLISQLTLFLTVLSIFVPIMILSVMVILESYGLLLYVAISINDLAISMTQMLNIVIGLGAMLPLGAILGAVGALAFAILEVALNITLANLLAGMLTSTKYRLPLTKYDECEDCNCGSFFTLSMPGIFGIGDLDETSGNPNVDDPNCQIPALTEGSTLYYSEEHNEKWDNQGQNNTSMKGCYIISFDGSGFKGAFTTAMWTMVGVGLAVAWIPGVGAALGPVIFGVIIDLFIILIATFLLLRLVKIFFGLNEWRVRKNIYNGLCQGIFNMGFWASWIRGTLYHFRFDNKKIKTTDPTTLTETTTDYFCRDILVGPDDGLGPKEYYYRSCPYNAASGTFKKSNINAAYTFNYILPDSGGANGALTYRQMYKGINYPTTILELGTFEDLTTNNSCVDCGDSKDDDFFIDQLESSSAKSPGGILDYFINQKLMRYSFWEIQFTGINNWFGGYRSWQVFGYPSTGGATNRNNRVIKASTAGMAGGQHRLLDGDISQGVSFNNELGIHKYMSPFYYPEDPNYGPLPFSIIDPKIQAVNSNIPFKVADLGLRNKVMGNSGGYSRSQTIPMYPWKKTSPTFGTRNNSWDASDGTSMKIITNKSQPGPIIVPPTGPIVDIPSTSEVSMGYYHYYFGLYQGNNAYDKFVNGYMPPTD